MTAATYSDHAHEGFLSRLVAGFRHVSTHMLASRQAEADRLVAFHLLSMDDESLKSHGYDRKTLQAMASRSGRV
ncbi:MAG: hypothetical protein AAF638_12055 [Pseudomonadota bacterium]